MIRKKGLTALGALAVAGCVGIMAPSVQAAENASVNADIASDMPHRVVEGGDFKTATLRPDRLLETYRLTKYDVIDI